MSAFERTGGRDRVARGVSWGGRRAGRISAALVATLVATMVGAGTGAAATAPYDPQTDPYSLAATAASMGAPAFWDAGFTGRGVDVAIIDSGVNAVPGLDGPDKLFHGPDLSFESQAPNLRNLDTFGHGTFMAGLIAGRDAALTAPYSAAPASVYRGVAPDARILSLKVATADGGTDVSQVIAAVNWVIQHRNDNGMNVRVLNLSYSVNSSQSYLVDPLAFAIEQAWQAGIFVVASSGNSGFIGQNKASGNIGMPARDPFVLAVGASDTKGTRVISDDTVSVFSSGGGLARRNDLVAPGTSMQGLRVPGSFIDTNFPKGRRGERYFKGSGTSQSAAMVSGAAALLLQQRPTLTPSELKGLLVDTAVADGTLATGPSSILKGAGTVDLVKALGKTQLRGDGPYAPSTGTGSLDAARGSDRLTDGNVVLAGEQDIFGKPFFSGPMALLEAARTSWFGGWWNGSQWTGSSWSGRSWSGAEWTGRSWSGRSWSGRSWTGRSWTGRSWTTGDWTGSSLSGRSWSGGVWATGSWG